MPRRLLAAALLATAFAAAVPAHAASGPQWICPWSVSKAVGDATGRYICYA